MGTSNIKFIEETSPDIRDVKVLIGEDETMLDFDKNIPIHQNTAMSPSVLGLALLCFNSPSVEANDNKNYQSINIPKIAMTLGAIEKEVNKSSFNLKKLQILLNEQSEEAVSLNKDIDDRLNQISELKFNWDGYNASPPNKEAIGIVRKFLLSLPENAINALDYDEIVPSPYGTIIIEWQRDDYFVSIEIGDVQSGFFSELPNDEAPYNDKLLSVTNPVPQDFIDALDKLLNYTV